MDYVKLEILWTLPSLTVREAKEIKDGFCILASVIAEDRGGRFDDIDMSVKPVRS